jgi:hypothetical protein
MGMAGRGNVGEEPDGLARGGGASHARAGRRGVIMTDPGGDDGRRRAPKVLLAALLILYLGQLAVIEHYGEPYPALTMPDFPDRGRPFDESLAAPEVRFVVRFADDTTARLTLAQVLAKVPEPMRWAIVANNFSPDRFRPPSAHVEPLAHGLLAGRQVMWQRVGDRSLAHAARAWLRQRCEALFPGRRAVSVAVQWYDTAVNGDPRLRYEGTVDVR